MKKFGAKVIALDFYDGATEGLISSFDVYGTYYFKLLAWDANQDQRLYFIVPIEELIYERIVEILLQCNVFPSRTIWVPKWSFDNNEQKEEIEQLIQSIRSKVNDKQMLWMGSQISDEFGKFFQIVGGIAISLKK